MHPRFRLTDGRLLRLVLCGLTLSAAGWAAKAAEEPPHSAELDRMIVEQAKINGVPEKLVRRIVMRESKYDPRARNHKYWGLMQISYPTAKSMGFRGTPEELLNPLTNLRYAVPYLANAFIIAGRREDEAVRLYAAGYYFTARQRGLLGVLRTGDSNPSDGTPDVATVAAAPPPPPPSNGIFGALFGPSEQPAAQAQPQFAQQVATAETGVAPASAAPVGAAPANATAPVATGDKASAADDVAMVADKAGNMEPPKKWLHDGGRTEIARGDQGIEHVAAYVAANGAAPARKTARKSHKTTDFAQIDLTPPSSAQAYASPEGQDPRFAQAAPQAAIAQATSPGAFPSSAAAAPSDATGSAPPAEAQAAPVADAPAKPTRTAHKTRQHGTDSKVADASDANSTHKHSAHHAKKGSDTAVATAQHEDGAQKPN